MFFIYTCTYDLKFLIKSSDALESNIQMFPTDY